LLRKGGGRRYVNVSYNIRCKRAKDYNHRELYSGKSWIFYTPRITNGQITILKFLDGEIRIMKDDILVF